MRSGASVDHVWLVWVTSGATSGSGSQSGGTLSSGVNWLSELLPLTTGNQPTDLTGYLTVCKALLLLATTWRGRLGARGGYGSASFLASLPSVRPVRVGPGGSVQQRLRSPFKSRC